MEKLNKKTRNLIILAVIVGVCAAFVTTAWATISFVKPEKAPAVQGGDVSEIPAELPEQSKSRAPEPASILMFAFGLIVSFVRKVYHIVKRVIGFVRVNAEKETGPVWAAENDNRLIPCGKFLRKAHIDEIPQFLNIFKGDMSLIGPRPERPVFIEKLKDVIPDYEKRMNIKPGLTGLAQVWHRYDETIEDVKKKIKYDLLYIRKMCLWTDIRIVLRTVRVVFTGEGAR